MRAMLRSWAALNRLERAGYTGLGSLLILLVAVRMTLGWFVPPPKADPEKERALAAAWASFTASHPAEQQENDAERALAYAPDLSAQPFPFDPNTLDSAGFRRLGLSPKAVKGLMGWRRGGMVFRDAADFSRLYNLPPEQYQKLRPYIRIDPSLARSGSRPPYPPWQNRYAPPPATVDLNTVDSATLVRMPAIGPTLAHRILAYRDGLGGFLDHKQLLEVFRFPDTTLQMLQERLIIRPDGVRRMGLNAVGVEQLSRHPYIGGKMAVNIVRFRDALGRFTTVSQLRQVPDMNAEIFRRIAAYFVAD